MTVSYTHLDVYKRQAEASALTREEKQQVMRCVLKQSDRRVCVWMGCGTNNTAETLDLIRWVNTEPVDGIMLVCPYYVRPSQQGLYAHFAACARVSEKPLMLYNVPKRSGVALSAETVLRLAQDYPQIRALKPVSYTHLGRRPPRAQRRRNRRRSRHPRQ